MRDREAERERTGERKGTAECHGAAERNGTLLGASPRHPRAACHPVDLAKPDHTVSRACEKHEIAKVMALDAV